MKIYHLAKKLLLATVVLIVGWVAFTASSTASAAMRNQGQNVDDQADVLSQKTIDRINNKNHHLKQGRIFVLTIDTTDGKSIGEVAHRYYANHRFRTKTALLVIAVDDRKVRLQTGSSLKTIFPRGYLNTILTTDVKNNFRDEDFDTGVMAMVSSMSNKLNNSTGQKKQSTRSYIIYAIIGLVIALILIFISIRIAQNDESKAQAVKLLKRTGKILLGILFALVAILAFFGNSDDSDGDSYDGGDSGEDGSW